MKSDGRSLRPLLCAVSLIMLIVFSTSWLMTNNSIHTENQRVLLSDSHRVLAYQISNNCDAVFRIPPDVGKIEIVTNLDVNKMKNSDQNQHSDYSLGIEIRNSRSVTLRKEVFWERTNRSQWSDKKTGKMMAAAFYMDGSGIPADSRITTLFLPESSGDETFVSIRVIEPARSTALVRVYHHVDMINNQELKAVQQISKRMRSKIARHNLYGFKVSDFEIKQFLKDVWCQLPAEGRSGRDYITRNIFLYNKEIPILGEQPPECFTVTEDLPLFLPFTGPASLSVLIKDEGDIRLVSYNDTEEREEQVLHVFENDTFDREFGVGNHLVEICSEQNPIRIQSINLDPESAWFGSHDDSKAPLPFRVTNYYRVLSKNMGEPVTIKLPAPLTDKDHLIKIVCRLPLADRSALTGETYELYYSFKDAEGQILMSNSIVSEAVSSEYALYNENNICSPQYPSYPDRFFIRLPGQTRTIEFTSSKPIDVALFSRTNAPSMELINLDNNKIDTGPSGFLFCPLEAVSDEWFYFRPVNTEKLAQTDRQIAVRLPVGIVERQPREKHLELSRKSAKSLYPDELYNKDIIVETVINTHNQNEYYKEIHTGTVETFEMDLKGGFESNLRFRYFISRTRSSMIEVLIDGKTAAEFRPLTFKGFFEVPVFESGSHELKIRSSSDDDRFYIRISPGIQMQGNCYKHRSVFKLAQHSTLNLDLPKTGWESCGVNIMVYSESNLTDSIAVDVKVLDLDSVAAGHPSRLITTGHRHYISSDIGISQSLYLSDGTELTEPSRLFFPLYDDVPPGNYKLQISSRSNKPIYLRFFVMTQETS